MESINPCYPNWEVALEALKLAPLVSSLAPRAISNLLRMPVNLDGIFSSYSDDRNVKTLIEREPESVTVMSGSAMNVVPRYRLLCLRFAPWRREDGRSGKVAQRTTSPLSRPGLPTYH
jgi:hypothetical protein